MSEQEILEIRKNNSYWYVLFDDGRIARWSRGVDLGYGYRLHSETDVRAYIEFAKQERRVLGNDPRGPDFEKLIKKPYQKAAIYAETNLSLNEYSELLL